MIGRVEALRQLAGWNPEDTYDRMPQRVSIAVRVDRLRRVDVPEEGAHVIPLPEGDGAHLRQGGEEEEELRGRGGEEEAIELTKKLL